MVSFRDIEQEAPDLAARAQAVISSTINAVLGTIRRDGTPRLSGIDPYFEDGELRIGSMADARKGQDLRRDPRVVVHSIPWESRRLREGADHPGDADVKVTGAAVLVSESSDADLFRIDVDSIVVISVDKDQLVIDRWSAADGRHTVRRS